MTVSIATAGTSSQCHTSPTATPTSILQLFQCCGFDGPNDWDRNDYFNCSGPALQSCGVPFSCCREVGGVGRGWLGHTTWVAVRPFVSCSYTVCCSIVQNDNTRNNFQCGYRVREPGQEGRLASDINIEGCLTTASAVIVNSSIVLGGIGIGLVVLEVGGGEGGVGGVCDSMQVLEVGRSRVE